MYIAAHGRQYLSGTVVNALQEQHGEFLLKELVRRWSNHKIMNQWMQKFFQYLDRCVCALTIVSFFPDSSSCCGSRPQKRLCRAWGNTGEPAMMHVRAEPGCVRSVFRC